MKKHNEKPFKNLILVTAIILIILTATIGVYFKIYYSSAEKTLNKFYNAVYISSDLDDMKNCLIDDYSYYFEQAVTFAGANPKFYESYKDEAVKLFGDNYSIDVKITEKKPVSSSQLQKLKDKYSNISSALDVTYNITFSSSNGVKTYSNSLEMANVNGKWYMTTHLQLPIGKNTFAY